MSRDEFIKNYWRYYLALEEHVQKIEKYVDFTEDNYNTYSVEFISCLIEIGSEVDVVMKNICGFSGTERKNMSDYATYILGEYQDIKTQEIRVRGMVIKPFEKWTTDMPADSLEWWNAYNGVKHGRNINYQLANLKNVIYSLAGLFLLEMYRIKELAVSEDEPDIPEKKSELFEVPLWETMWFDSSNMYYKIKK